LKYRLLQVDQQPLFTRIYVDLLEKVNGWFWMKTNDPRNLWKNCVAPDSPVHESRLSVLRIWVLLLHTPCLPPSPSTIPVICSSTIHC
jgi:hypothetical protein